RGSRRHAGWQAENVGRLSKQDVEDLLAVVASPPDDLAAEVEGLRAALTEALASVLGRTGSWEELVAAAGLDGQLLSADLKTARDAMWDLAARLNEERDVRPSGRDQREAVSAIERAITALTKGDGAGVRRAVAAVADLDRASVYPGLPAALEAAAAELDGGSLSPSAAAAVVAALGPGPLAAEAEQRLAR